MSSLGLLGDPKIIKKWTRGDPKCVPNRKKCRFLRGCFFSDFLEVKNIEKKGPGVGTGHIELRSTSRDEPSYARY